MPPLIGLLVPERKYYYKLMSGNETTGRNVASDGQADHLVSGGGDTRDQLPADVAVADPV
jgi:hypothetical protein